MSQVNQKNIPERADERIDLRRYLQVIYRFKWLILLIAIVITLVGAVFIVSTPLAYRATATLLIEAGEAKAVSIEDVYGLDSSRQEYFQTQFEILKSRQLAERVIERLDLPTHREFQIDHSPRGLQLLSSEVKRFINEAILGKPHNTIKTKEQRLHADRSALISRFMGKLSVIPIRKTQLVDISFTSGDPQLAAQMANTLGELYIESHLEEKMSLTLKASGWIKERLDELKIKLKESEDRLQLFREENKLVDVEGVVALASQELNELTSQLSEARQTRTMAQATMRFLEATSTSDLERLSAMPEISDHKMIQDIKKAEADVANEIAQLSKRYGPKHNKMIAARARQDEIRANLQARVKQLVEGIAQEYQSAVENERELKAELDELKQRFQILSRLETEYRVLDREVQANRELYDTFLTRMKETGAVGDFQAAHARFTDRAQVPVMPTKANKKVMLFLIFVVGTILGTIISFVLDALSNTIKSPADIESLMGMRVIGLTPRFKRNSITALPVDCFSEKNAQKYNEVWRTLRSSYMLSHIDSPAKVVALTSTLSGEGKSTTAINFAYSLAQVEKVLLIEADMRRPTLGKRFELPNYQPGFFNLIARTHNLDECIYHDTKTGLDILVSGSMVPNPLEQLSSPDFVDVIERLKERYDRIVIDTPPSHVVSDALVIARAVDSFLYVVRSGMVRHKTALEAVNRLQAINARIDGVVLNCVSENAARSHYGYKYDGYYSYAPTEKELALMVKRQLAEETELEKPMQPTGLKLVEPHKPMPIAQHDSTEELTVEEKVGRLLVLAKEAMQQREYSRARKHLTEIYSLNIDLPLSFYYRMAYAMYMSGEKEQADKTARYYMKKAGKSGKYYEQARKLVS